jgi:tripartite-type tricarboxylate transporter receptor subunit TctC
MLSQSRVDVMKSSRYVNPHLRKVNYGPLTSFEPVCYLVSWPLGHRRQECITLPHTADLLTAARDKPGDLTLAGSGPATINQLAIEKLKRAADVNMTFVPFSGDAPAWRACDVTTAPSSTVWVAVSLYISFSG